MGSAASKVPKRAFPKAMPAQRSRPAERTEVDQAAEATVPGLSKAVEAAPKFERAAPGQFHAEPPSPEQEQDFLLQLKREGVKDSELGSFLDKLGGAIAGKQISTQDLKTGTGAKANVRRDVGRLDTEALRKLFQDVHQIEQRQQSLDTHAHAKRYGVDPALLEEVLRFNRVPAITQAPDGRLFGTWHAQA